MKRKNDQISTQVLHQTKKVFLNSKSNNEECIEIAYETSHTKLILPNLIRSSRHTYIYEELEPQTLILNTSRAPIIEEEYTDEELIEFNLNEIQRLKTKNESLKGLNKKENKKHNIKLPLYFDTSEVLKSALDLHDQGYKISYIARLYSISPKSIYWLKEKRENTGIATPEKVGRRTKIKQSYLDYLESYLSNPQLPSTSLITMKNLLIRRFKLNPKEISIDSIHQMIKKIGFSRKRTYNMHINRNIKDNVVARRKLALQMLNYKKNGYLIISLDEVGFNTALTPIYGYSRIGKRCARVSNGKSTNYSVLAAMDEDQLLGCQIFDGSVKGADFGAFIINLINNTQKLRQNLDKIIVFCDNSSVHKAKVCGELFSKIKFQYNVPYSPFLNAIEEVFGAWKYYFRKIDNKTNDSILRNIIDSALALKKYSFSGYVKHVHEHYIDCIDMKDIE